MSGAWLGEWNLLYERVEGLSRAAAEMRGTLGVHSQDLSSVVRKIIGPATLETIKALQRFRTRFADSLPKGAVLTLSRLDSLHLNLTNDAAALGNLQVMAGVLATVSEVDFCLGDAEIAGQRLVDRAFLHLNRSLVVDPQMRARWKAAFKVNEPACEKLGAVHLLGHGIYAFKTSAAGGATDLVLSKPLTGEHAEAADFLVLTEWKRVVDEQTTADTAAAARTQATAYTQHVLAGVELRRVRYVVLVSLRQLVACPADVQGAGGVTFRHVNVAVDPDSPSVLGRRSRSLSPSASPAQEGP